MILFSIFLTTSFAMKKAHKYIQILLFFLTFITPGCFFINAQDSTTVSHELKELVVKDKRAIVEHDKVVFLPTKKEKNLSNSPETLLEAMHLPMLKVSGNNVSTISGESISYFINGHPVSKTDLSTFWPSEILKVEYIPNPRDPRYAGAKVAINFIRRRYEIGGVTRIDGFQRFPNNGIYEISSRLEYKKMSYGLMVTGSYKRDHRSKTIGNEKYNDIYYGHTPYDEISREYKQNDYTRDEDIDVAFNAKYQTNNILVSHSVFFNADRNPGSGYHSADSWNPSLFNSNESYHHTDGSKLAPQLSGQYYWKLNSKWALNANWVYSYAKKENKSTIAFNVENPVLSNFSENVNSARLNFIPVLRVNDKVQLRLYLRSQMNWYDAKYTGTSTVNSKQRRGESSSKFAFLWWPKNNLALSINPGVVINYWAVGTNSNETLVRPSAEGTINWNYKKWMFGGRLSWYTQSPGASASNDIIIKSTDLMWLAGNKGLKDLTSWSTNVSATWFPTNWFSTSFNTHFEQSNNSFLSIYEAASPDMGGVIKTDINSDKDDFISANISLNFNILQKLSLSISPYWTYQKTRGVYARNLHKFSIYGDMDYKFGRCSLNLAYEPKQKTLFNGGAELYRQTDRFNIGFKYGNGNLYVAAKIEDVFHKHERRITHYSSHHYTSSIDHYLNGRCFTINVTYTLGYGKKVEDASIGRASEVTSSMLNY